MKKLILVVSPKGGVGKSFSTRLIYESMIETFKGNVLLADCDHRVRAIAKTYPEEAIQFNLTKDSERSRLISLGETSGDKHIIIDFAGGSIGEIQELMSGDKNPSLFFDLFKDFGFDPTVVVPFNYELNSQLAFKDIHQAFGSAGENAKYFFVQNLKGIAKEEDCADYFQGYDGSMPDIHLHPYLKDFIPQDFAIDNLGLETKEVYIKDADGNDTNEVDGFGTTKNLIRIHQMPGNLGIWVHDAVKFNEASVKAFPAITRITAVRYFNTLKNRLNATDLLK